MRRVIGTDSESLLVNAATAAKMLGISPRTLWSLTASYAIPHIRIGRCVRYPVDQLQQWVEEQTKGGTANGGT